MVETKRTNKSHILCFNQPAQMQVSETEKILNKNTSIIQTFYRKATTEINHAQT